MSEARRNRSRGRPRRHDAPGRLVRAATDLVAERGYAGAGLNEICKRASVAKTSLYWHFGDKEGLLAEVVRDGHRELHEEIRKSVAKASDRNGRLDALIRAWRTIVLERPNLMRLPFQIQLSTGSEEASARRVLADVWSSTEKSMAEDFSHFAGLPAEDLEPVVHTAMALFQGAFIRYILDPDVQLLDRNLDELKRTLLESVRVRLSEASGQYLRSDAQDPPD